MLISQTAEYALRAMAYIASLGDGEAARALDVAEGTRIPQSYAAKVLRRMASRGLLVGQKGHGGGFRLARPAERVRFHDILEAADNPILQNHCAFGWGQCSPKKPCPLHPAVSELVELVDRWAHDTTLADVRDGKASLRPPLPAR